MHGLRGGSNTVNTFYKNLALLLLFFRRFLLHSAFDGTRIRFPLS